MGWTKHVQPRPQKLFGSIYAQRNIPISQNRTKRNRVTRYDMSNITVSTDNYVELALGHARDINDKLGVGAKVKVLVGAAHAEARIDRMDISMSPRRMVHKQAGHIQASSLLKLETDPETGEITDYDTGDFGVAGFGLGFDLGATYELIDNLTLSAALTDIGFMQLGTTSLVEKPIPPKNSDTQDSTISEPKTTKKETTRSTIKPTS